MITLAHVVNPFAAPQGSDLARTQPLTFASMRGAKEKAGASTAVELWAALLPDDELPDGFQATAPLLRTVLDVGDFNQPRALPLIADILEGLYTASSASHFIFTNVDIILHEDFYAEVAQRIAAGQDAFIINRRRVADQSYLNLEAIWAAPSKPHPGFDCFVFARHMLPQFSLGNICIGVPFIGIGLAQNLFCFGKQPTVYTDDHLTFHLGMEVFYKRAPKAYFRHNQRAFWQAMDALMPQLDSRKWPSGQKNFFVRFLRWGLHPSLPIRLALKLEPRRWKR